MLIQTETDVLRRNVKDLQIQLRDAHIRIKELNEKLDDVRKRFGINKEYTTDDGWAMPVENPDAVHIKEKDNENT
jgi:predicted RNase H-like nuclease (RuvC/YqgF family)|tara:strand:+ start:172 stop:396 length:225 start_codon:yes stop_codon:yes gene_type:complete